MTEPQLTEAEHHRDLLGQALGDLLVHVGMIRKDSQMTGPELLAAAEVYRESTLPVLHGQPGQDWRETLALSMARSVRRCLGYSDTEIDEFIDRRQHEWAADLAQMRRATYAFHTEPHPTHPPAGRLTADQVREILPKLSDIHDEEWVDVGAFAQEGGEGHAPNLERAQAWAALLDQLAVFDVQTFSWKVRPNEVVLRYD